MKIAKYLKATFLLAVLAFLGCQENDYTFGEIIAPSNIQITAEIVGADDANPNGDGSGVVNFKATADNTISYKYVFDGVETVALSGETSISFSSLGLNSYTITVVAAGTAGVSSTKSIQVDVLSTYAPPEALISKLYGYDPATPNAVTSRTWKIQSVKAGHFGLGPIGGSTPTEWYSAGIEEKAGVGMYDDRFVFSSDGTFTYVTNGDIFGRSPHIVNDLGPNTAGSANGADIENYAFADYTESYTLTAPGGVEIISLSGNAFIGYYSGGNHQYEIFERETPNEMIVRTTDGTPEFDWWFIIVSE
ncbi:MULTISPECIES: glucan endo-1,3-beta-D-glucosidase [unclassified Polaribacter]|uniref:glucan endo-1,3-beta-D-glucosidase n=1 Tax=unclassified Polaribacter TaxID=196858 RepID=UPI0011BED583|nr:MULTISPECIES: glucan endo-1,3-beta-D-glucosidase [unclassified Polaribacter]TXD51928.1 glucan endo-1,3-beta-D-glucosidase [Polaribacter sp. IC063]TXD59728.1 glucan endo-1,3-beta-D-glucosidase [Polaribacter sp. IC066]